MTVGPDPAGARPDGMRPEEWAAFVALSEGKSLAAAGRLVGRERSTVSGWVTKWRARWGDDLLRNRSAQARPPEQSALGVVRAGEATQKRWAEVRDAASGRFGLLADEALEAAMTVIRDTLADPDRRKALTMSDALMLARISDMAAKRADTLADVVDPTRSFLAGQGAGGGDGPQGLLAGLETAPGAADGETLEMLEMVVDGFLHLIHGDGEGGAGDGFSPVEVSEARAS